MSTEEGGSIPDDEITSDRGGGGVVDELFVAAHDDMANSNGVDVTGGGGDVNAFLQGRGQHTLADKDTGDGKTETSDSSEGGVVDVFSATAWIAER